MSSCPFCGGFRVVETFHGNLSCVSCVCAWTPNPTPFNYETSNYFQGGKELSYDASGYEDMTENHYLRRKQGVEILKRVNELRGLGLTLNAPPGWMLEMGAAYGYMSEPFLMAGWDCTAIEPNEQARGMLALYSKVGELRKKGTLASYPFLSALTKTALTELPEKYDFAIGFDIFEHVPNLQEELLQLEKLLKQGGLFLMHVPNFAKYRSDKTHRHWAVKQHLFHADAPGWTRLLARHNLDVFQVEEGKLCGNAELADVDSVTLWARKR